MKKSLLAVLLIAVFMFSACQAKKTDDVAENPETLVVEEVKEEKDTRSLYDDILKEYYNVIKTSAKTGEFVEGKQGVSENAAYYGSEALSKIGYAFEDVNKDGVEELLIGMEDEFSISENTLFLNKQK